ncbi:MAG: hypothetical protein AAGK21_01200 [Bacteroidota bacterium]
MRRVFPSFLAGVLVLGLAACDAADPGTPDLGPGAFEATVASSAASATIGGAAASSLGSDRSTFDGTFGAYVIAETEDGTRYTFSSIQLTADSGEQILLGSIAPGDELASGAYGIETSRNLDAPFDFVALYDDGSDDGRGGRSADRAIGGSVEVDVDGRLVSGTFDLEFPGSLSVSGSFNAAPADG